MKRPWVSKLVFYLYFLCVFTLHAQNNIHYYFKTLDIKDGLSQNTVNTICRINKVLCGLEPRTD